MTLIVFEIQIKIDSLVTCWPQNEFLGNDATMTFWLCTALLAFSWRFPCTFESISLVSEKFEWPQIHTVKFNLKIWKIESTCSFCKTSLVNLVACFCFQLSQKLWNYLHFLNSTKHTNVTVLSKKYFNCLLQFFLPFWNHELCIPQRSCTNIKKIIHTLDIKVSTGSNSYIQAIICKAWIVPWVVSEYSKC